jgi:CheY-like chemotaxis protein
MTVQIKKTILMADDDEDDCFLAREALEAGNVEAAFSSVADGVELMDALLGTVGDSEGRCLPDLILLDLNMPRKDGRQTLLEIRANPALRHLPVVVFTTSQEERDRLFMRKAGADSFITKPVAFDEWVEIMKHLQETWLTEKPLPPS